jgi:protein O-mannosyl-transferase
VKKRKRTRPRSDAVVPPPQPAAADPRHPWRIAAACAALVALVWLVFGQAVGHEFVNYDDPMYVQRNEEINRGLTLSGISWAFTNTHGHNWHPVTSISHMLDAELSGLEPRGHHFTSVLLHSATAALLFVALLQMTGSFWPSLFVAAVFAIHPLRAESVAWVSERKDVLSGLFFVLTLIAYTGYVRRRSAARYAAAAVLLALGLMSKPMLVTVPFVLLLIDYWPLKREATFRQLVIEKIPLLLLVLGASIATVLAQSGALISAEQLPFTTRIGNALTACVTYLRQLFWPGGLAAFYPFRFDRALWEFVGAGTLLLSATGAAVLLRKRLPYVFTGWFWFVGMLVPVIGLVQVGSQAHADRYTYLPHIGLLVLFTWLVVDATRRWRVSSIGIAAAAAVVIATLSWRAHAQTATWRDTETLWRHALAVTQNNNVAHKNLAAFLLTKNRINEAITHLRQELAIRSDNPEAHVHLGLALLQTGNASAGIAHWQRALDLNPDDPNAQSNLAWVYATAPDPALRNGAAAVELAQNVIANSGARTPLLLRTLAAAFAEAGRFSEAVSATREAIAAAQAEGDSAFAAELQQHIYQYENGIPTRDSSLADARPITLP